jgi:hypothetical protein
MDWYFGIEGNAAAQYCATASRTMKILRVLFVCSGALLLVSCTSVLPPLVSFARFASPVDQSFQVDTNTAVVYGRFQKKSDMGGGNQIALRLRNERTKKEYLIQMRKEDAVYGIAVEPGRYRIAGFVATFAERRTAGRRAFRNTPLFDVGSNSIVYLGDFQGYTQGLLQLWEVRGVTNNFAATTEEFRKKHSQFASLSAVSTLDEEAR